MCILVLAVGLAAGIAALCRGIAKQAAIRGAIAGMLLASLHLVWVLMRPGPVTVISKATSFHWLAIVCTFVLTGSAATLFLLARSTFGRVLALLVATFPAWLPAVLHSAFALKTNVTAFRPNLGVSIYTYDMSILAASSFLIVLGVVASVFTLLRRGFISRARAVVLPPGS